MANISHEFRTPLTAIQGFAETLLGGALDDTANRRRFVEIIRNHATRLARLTEDLLELSRIEAGQMELEFRPVSVQYLIESCLETARLKAAQRDLIVEVDIPDGLPSIRGDANRLQEVLQNLLDNAVQYTPENGRIDVQAAQVGGAVVLTVADTGIGIPQAEQGRVFERFYRVDAARSREAGGTGLGLSIRAISSTLTAENCGWKAPWARVPAFTSASRPVDLQVIKTPIKPNSIHLRFTPA